MIRILKNNSGGKLQWHYAGQEVLICTNGGKNLIVRHVVAQFMDVLLGVIHTNTLILNLL